MVLYKKWLVIGLLLSVTACSGGGDQQSTDEAVGNAKAEGDIPENGSLTNNKGNSANGEGNIANEEGGGNAANNAGGNNAGGNAGNSEQINNAEGENFGNNGKNAGNQGAGGGNNFLAEDAGAGGEGINNATASEDGVDAGLGGGGLNTPTNPAVDAPATDASVNSVVDQAAVGDVDPASTETAPSVTPGPAGPTGPMVKYVPGTGADIFKDSPGTEVVGKFTQGDHPLVYENGEWARLSDGHFVQNSALSVTPIPRPKRPAIWQ